MSNYEDRLTALEQEHAYLKHENDDLKQKIELHTIAIGGLVNKAMLERISEKNDKIFQALMAHDELTNLQLAELRERVEVQVEGKIIALQTEVRQLQTEVRQLQTEVHRGFNTVDARFVSVETMLAQILARLPEKP